MFDDKNFNLYLAKYDRVYALEANEAALVEKRAVAKRKAALNHIYPPNKVLWDGW